MTKPCHKDPILGKPLRLRDVVLTGLGAAVVALDHAEANLRRGSHVWPAADCDMTVHEIEEARRLIGGIAIRLRTEIANLQPTKQHAVGNA